MLQATPVSKAAEDPDKVSHHIHRVGYHFRAEVVEEACQALGYVLTRKGFVKEAQLEEQRENSKMAQALAKFGVGFDVGKETNLQVMAAVKELFPKMPEQDLTQVLRHAWEEGANRIGTNMEIDLPRRVQLAVLARIRHEYTDYDRLLRAFEWKEARALVEPVCLKKLIEWRGEVDDGNDDELEEIVRETIVIDDDDDDILSEADDEGSIELDDGNASDTSIEISHRPVALDDIGAESHDENSRRFLQKYRPAPPAPYSQRRVDVHRKIDAVRQQMRNAPPAGNQRCVPDRISKMFVANAGRSDVVRVTVPPGEGSIVIDGRLYQRQPAAQQQREYQYHALPPMPQNPPYAYQPVSPPHSRSSSSFQHPERVISSIEHVDKQNGRPDHHPQHHATHSQPGAHVVERGAAGSVIGLASPRSGQIVRQPMWPVGDCRNGFVNASVAPIQYVPHPQQNGQYEVSAQSRAPVYQTREYPRGHHQAYGSKQPQQVIYVEAARGTPQPVHGAPAAVQQLPRAGAAPGQMQPLDARYAVPGIHPYPVAHGHAPHYYYP